MLAKVTAHNAEPLNLTFTEAKTSLTILGGGSILIDLNATEEANIRATLQAQAETVSSIKETTGSVRPVVVDPAPPEGSKKARFIEEAEALGVETAGLDYADLTRGISVAKAATEAREHIASASTETTTNPPDDDGPPRPNGPAEPSDDEEPEDLQSMTVVQLKERAKAKGIAGFSGMSKADLLEALDEE